MKKLKLLLMACALMGAGEAFATDWVGNEPANGEFYLYNVGAKKYLSFGENWSSIATADHAGIPVTLTAGSGTYTIVTNVAEKGKGLFMASDMSYTDGTPGAWTFTDANVAGKHVYTLKSGDAYLYWSGTEVNQVLSKTDDVSEIAAENLQWQLVTKAERDAAFTGKNASETEPLDITYKYIENPNTTWFTNVYSTNNPWTQGGAKGWDVKSGASDWWDGKDNTYEVYNGNFDNYIEITDIPNGIYEFGVQGFYRDGNAANAIAHYHAGTFVENAKIYANNNTTSLQSIGVSNQTSEIYKGNDKSAEVSGTTYYVPDSPLGGSLYFLRGKYPWQTVRTVVTNNTLKFGVKKETTIGTDWTLVDKFYLSYLGVDLAALKDAMDEAIATAEGIDQSKLPTAIKDELATVISTYKGQSYSTEDDYNTATTNINNAIGKANASIPLFADFNTLKGQADALVAVENTNAEANSILSAAISAQNTAVAEATTTAAISTAFSTLKAAMITYAGAADPTSGNRFDLTFMMTNPTLDAFAAWTKDIPGWDSEETDGNYQAMVNDSKTVGDKDHFYEYWSDPAKASGKFALYNAVTLPVGTYSMSCYAFAENQYAANTVNGVFFYANDTQGSAVTSTVLSEQSISFINESEQEVKIGLKTQTGNTRNWMGIGYVKLYKEYTDNGAYNITATIDDGDVAITVDGVAATSAKALKTVTLTASNLTEGYAVGNVTATYNDGEVKYLDVANPSENVYTYQQPAYAVTVTMSVVVDKRALNNAIAAATAARKSANEGTGVFQIPAAVGETLATAIATAQGVYDEANATVADVAGAVTAINSAKATYEGATLNAPEADKRYYLNIIDDGQDWDGNAITFIAGGRNGEGNYNVQYLASANTNLCQALKLTAVKGATNTYYISAVRADGGEQYLTTKKLAYGEGAHGQIRTTDDATKAMKIKIQATTTDGQFKLLNVEADNAVIARNATNPDNGVYTDGDANFTIAEANQASVGVSINADVKYGTRIFPFTPTLPEGVKAYSCSEATGKTLTLVEVEKPAAGTPYILEASDKVEETLTGWGVLSSIDATTVGLLTGVYTSTQAPAGKYVLQNNDKVAFYLVGSGNEPTVGAYRCYLDWPDEDPQNARAFFFPENNATAIKAINALTSGKAEIFNASGAKIPALQKGMNIIRTADGKNLKVMVK